MREPQSHPSFFSLDRLALGQPTEESVRRHVDRCSRCRDHVAQIHLGPPHALRPPRVAGSAESFPAKRLWTAGAMGLAAAAALLLLLRPGGSPESNGTAFTTRRGAASVAVYVKHGPVVSLWDGTSPIAAGDKLRLAVVPEGFTHVGVFAGGEGKSWRALFAAEVAPDQQTLLPRAWEVDEAPGPERLRVVLSDRPVDEASMAAYERGGPKPALWVRTLEIPKRTPAELSGGKKAGEP